VTGSVVALTGECTVMKIEFVTLVIPTHQYNELLIAAARSGSYLQEVLEEGLVSDPTVIERLPFYQ